MGCLQGSRGLVPSAVIAAILATLTALPAGSAPGELTPAPGRYLVAKRQIEGPLFARSIVLLVDVSGRGAAGLIVNRPTRLLLRELMKNVPPDRQDRVHMGGPVAPGGMLFLARTEEPPTGSRRIRGDLHLGESAAGLRELIARGEPADRVRGFLGHAGWASGQLDGEIARGDWFVIEGDAALAFDDLGDESWERQLAPLEALRVLVPGVERRVGRR